jgi:uncharacterized protein YjbJ (UPF0337 family)
MLSLSLEQSEPSRKRQALIAAAHAGRRIVGESLRPRKAVSDRQPKFICPHCHAGTPALRRLAMNRNQVKGTVKDIAGKVQEKFGQMTGSTSQQAKGVAKQAEGKVQKGVGNVEQAAEDADKKTRP